MRCKNRVFLAIALLMTAFAVANTEWIGDANDVANWGRAANWTNGIPGTAAPADVKAVFKVPGAVECQVTDARACLDLVQGDGGPGGVLRVTNGATLTTTGDWMAIGYNNTAKLIVEEGGVCNFGGHLWWGMHTGADSIVQIDGGFVTNTGSFGLGEYFGTAGDHGQCKVYINNDGELNIHHWSGGLTSANPVFWNGSLIDIGFGRMVIRNDSAAQATEYINAGKITGFGGLSTPTAVFANGVTTITAPDPMHRAPAYTTILAGDVDLTWTNLAPVAPAADVWVDVWFGTEPNKLSLAYSKVLTKGKNTTSVSVNAPFVAEPTTYYWQVDSYLHGDPAVVVYDVNNIVTGAVTPFNVTTNTPPSVAIVTPPTATWIDQPIQLDSTVTDDHPEQITYLWTSDEPNAVFSPGNTVADPSVTVDWHAAQFVVTVTVTDGVNPPASANVTHDCATDPCQAATAVIHLNDVYLGDIAVDCKVNLTDFAAIARQWLTDYTLTGPVPIPVP